MGIIYYNSAEVAVNAVSNKYGLLFCIIVGGFFGNINYSFAKDSIQPICYGAERFENGDVRIEFDFQNCQISSKSKVFTILESYVKSCYTPHYKKILGIEFNSDRGRLQLGVSYPDMTPSTEIGVGNNQIVINLDTQGCDKRDDYDVSVLLKKKLSGTTSLGKSLFGKEENVAPHLMKYRALTNTRYNESDIYVLTNQEIEPVIIAECRNAVCKTDGYPFREGYYLSYTFSLKKILEIEAINNKIIKFMASKFD